MQGNANDESRADCSPFSALSVSLSEVWFCKAASALSRKWDVSILYAFSCKYLLWFQTCVQGKSHKTVSRYLLLYIGGAAKPLEVFSMI